MVNKQKYNFGLKAPIKAQENSFFTVTDPEDIQPHETKNIQIHKLVPFKKHPFRLYEGQRFEDMVESIKENGVLLPIIVRPLDDGASYEILSGHNRTEAAKAAGLEVIPAIVRENLSDNEAMLIVTETNLIQRSFADLSHSERAVTLAMHHEAIKRQGKRTDLISEIEGLLKNPENSNNETSGLLVPKLEAREKTANEYGLNYKTVSRYLRVNRLIDNLKKRLDSGEFGLFPAVEISYLSDAEQEMLNAALESPPYKLDMKKAAQLRELAKAKSLSADDVEEVLAGLVGNRSISATPPKLTIKPVVLSRFFTPQHKTEDMEAEIVAALEFYRASNQSGTTETE